MNYIASIIEQLPSLFLIILAACFTILGDYFGKTWSINHKQIFFLLAILGYAASGLIYTPVLLKQGLVISSVIWSISTILGFIFIGLILFHESLNTIQAVGVILGIVSLAILALYG